ncbi:MAG: hypothetical protein M5U23_04170 [Acidimicrobiia bacterium]|nr:hypothetical protein [Acidimicrobiia bacterium]
MVHQYEHLQGRGGRHGSSLILTACSGSASTATTTEPPPSSTIPTSTTLATTTTEGIAECIAFADAIWDYRIDSIDFGVFGVLSAVTGDSMTTDEGADELYQLALGYEEKVLQLAAMGDPPPEMVGPVFRVWKGMQLKAEALYEMSDALRVLSITGIEAAQEAQARASDTINSADLTVCEGWEIPPLDSDG